MPSPLFFPPHRRPDEPERRFAPSEGGPAPRGSLDGVADNLISNVGACVFDPNSVRCPGGTDTGDTCLSDAQIGALQVMNTDLSITYPNGSGSTGYPGFNVFARPRPSTARCPTAPSSGTSG